MKIKKELKLILEKFSGKVTFEVPIDEIYNEINNIREQGHEVKEIILTLGENAGTLFAIPLKIKSIPGQTKLLRKKIDYFSKDEMLRGIN